MKDTNDNAFLYTGLKTEPFYKDNYICLVFSSNNDFIKYLSVAIESIIENSKKSHYYDILVIHTDISIDNISLLTSKINKIKNFKIRFIDIRNVLQEKEFYIETKDKRLSKETYYRIYILDLLSDKYQKAIYIDCDMIVRKDIFELNKIDIENKYVAAVHDYIGIAICYKKNKQGKKRTIHRISNVKINNIDDYFGAGLLIMNLKELRKKYNSEKIEKICFEKEWAQHDQDVLNYICRDNKVKFINSKWNVVPDFGIIRYLPKELKNQYTESQKDPYIIHYGGSKKPWKSEIIFEKYFWKYAIQTNFYKEIIKKNMPFLISRSNIDYGFFKETADTEVEDIELIDKYICYALSQKGVTNIKKKNKSKEYLNGFIKLSKKRILYFKQYGNSINEEETTEFIKNYYNSIKILRDATIFRNIDWLFEKHKEIKNLCVFLQKNKKIIYKKKIMNKVNMLELLLISRYTYITWLISFLLNRCYKITKKIKNIAILIYLKLNRITQIS